MAWLPVNIAMILGHQDLTLGEGSDPCNGVISPLRSKPILTGVNEFYQKGCQEKSSASTGVEMLSRDPAHGN
jgi:hypothetical protein